MPEAGLDAIERPRAAPASRAPPYWALPIDELFARLGSTRDGLAEPVAAERLRRKGPNQIREERSASIPILLLRQVRSPLVLILIFAALIAAGLGEWVEASIILAIVLGSTLLGFSQEYRASAALAELRRRLELTTKVRREGAVRAIPVRELVEGDVVILAAGAVVPADAVVVQAQDLMVSQAVLTGESFPVEKRPGPLAADTSPVGRINTVFMGASVRSGTAEAVVVATGRRTQFGAVAERLKSRPTETEFARGMRRFGAMLIRVMTGVVLFVLTVNQLLGRPFIDSLLFAVALGVGMSPELLPAIISITLAAGARRMAARGVVVRQLEAIENLGAMTVFCTDKTGTLTEAAIELEAAVDPFGRASEEAARLGFLNAGFETGIENPLDQAILASGRKRGLSAAGYVKVDEIPYDFTRKRLTVVLDEPGGGRLMVTKGAVANVLEACATARVMDGEAVIDAAARERIEAYCRSQGEAGLRVLALASSRPPPKPDYGASDETAMRLEGFLVFVDPPKAEAAETIRSLAELGVEVKIVSGDNRHVVGHVAAALGLDAGAMLTGEELAKLKDEALWNLAPRTTLFAEVDPQQKERIVRALQRAGHAVGFLGDGINDAPALYAADVGVSVDQAVDVARESADVVLLRRDLDVLRLGIEGGRRTFANTLKYISITISANFGNMVSMALAAPLLPFLPMAAKQVLLNNFLSDLPAIALASDRVDPERIATPQRLGVKDIERFMVAFGLISSLFDLLTFVVLLRVLGASKPIFQTSWFVLSLMTELMVVLILRTQGPAWRSRPSRTLLAATAVVAVAGLAAPYLGDLSAAFGFAPLGLGDLGALGLITLGYVAATELGKRWFFGSSRRREPPRA
ncbi:magnesium-translocating P-type ATPase [Phenylobacterium sp.]|uniref:magnesium-translocating P-type ATPase n=1 Tax=Phenylobacterium sp. TaxID=1871053 RepID=UPI0035B3CBA8